MTGKEYQNLVTKNKNMEGSDKVDLLVHAICGLNSEAGNAAECIMKAYQGESFDKDNVMLSLSNCMWYLAEACESLNIDIDYIMGLNIAKLVHEEKEG